MNNCTCTTKQNNRERRTSETNKLGSVWHKPYPSLWSDVCAYFLIVLLPLSSWSDSMNTDHWSLSKKFSSSHDTNNTVRTSETNKLGSVWHKHCPSLGSDVCAYFIIVLHKTRPIIHTLTQEDWDAPWASTSHRQGYHPLWSGEYSHTSIHHAAWRSRGWGPPGTLCYCCCANRRTHQRTSPKSPKW